MTLEIVTIEKSPNCAVLTTPTKAIDFPLSQEIWDIIKEMRLKLEELDGSGLAANQVGIPLKLCLYQVHADTLSFREDAVKVVPITTLINPSYTPIPEAGKFADWEGCFSVTEWLGKVPRYSAILLEARTPEGDWIKERKEGYEARVLQHEIDHLNGVLIIDRLTPECVQGPYPEMLPILRQERIILRQEILERRKNKGSKDKS